jgi:Na+-transporting methylmalonyl-CoA/oxaloacetate decarboxylase gamma subunit
MIRELFSSERYTTEELNARLKFFIGIVLGLTLFGIVFVVLYSLIFVTQPMNGMSPVDNKFFELIIPIATFLTGTLSGIMLAGDDKDLRAKAIDAATRPTPVSPTPTSVSSPKSFTPSSPSAFTASTPVAASPFGAPVVTGFGGKAAPPPAFEPEL